MLLNKTNGKVVGDLLTPAPVVRETTNLEDSVRYLSGLPCDALNLDGDLVEGDDDCSMSFVVKLVAEPNSGGALHAFVGDHMISVNKHLGISGRTFGLRAANHSLPNLESSYHFLLLLLSWTSFIPGSISSSLQCSRLCISVVFSGYLLMADVIPLKSKPGPRKVNALVNKPELPYHAVAKNNDLAWL
uniref:Uncharacterized protein n=1 Tax=Populus alba TaxID=43335 RepID=A0A4U5MAB8_POPAL|nr:hypothetical protein D5086_0000316070 [Populus alba]